MTTFYKNLNPLLRRKKRGEDDPHYAVLDTIDKVLEESEENAINSKLQVALKTATDNYLDEWGSWFGENRNGDNDEDYRKRIIEKINIPRGTDNAIMLAMKKFTKNPNLPVSVRETWREIFINNESYLNGTDHLIGDMYNIAIIDIHTSASITPEMIQLVDDYKPAGVTMFFTYDPSMGEGDLKLIIRYTDMQVKHGATYVYDNGLIKGYSGELRPSQKLIETNFGLFIVDYSLINSSDVLAGDYYNTHSNINMVGVSNRRYNPSKYDTLGEVQEHMETILDDDSVALLDDKDDKSYHVQLNPTNAFYVTFNAEKALEVKEQIDWTIVPDVLNKAVVSVVLKSNSNTSNISFYLYNFTEKKWDNIKNDVMMKTYKTINLYLEDINDYLSPNGLLCFKIQTQQVNEVDIDRFVVKYHYRTKYITRANYENMVFSDSRVFDRNEKIPDNISPGEPKPESESKPVPPEH